MKALGISLHELRKISIIRMYWVEKVIRHVVQKADSILNGVHDVFLRVIFWVIEFSVRKALYLAYEMFKIREAI